MFPHERHTRAVVNDLRWNVDTSCTKQKAMKSSLNDGIYLDSVIGSVVRDAI